MKNLWKDENLMNKFKVNDKVVIENLNPVLNGKTGIILGCQTLLPLSTLYIVLWENPVDENRASAIPENYLKNHEQTRKTSATSKESQSSTKKKHRLQMVI